ncbi:Uncharacterised protein [Mycobacteroides abscessus subsp. abscessus]|nr:Uncharacterised protein [Mycobacteroides abscessus subsp. abscessus]
MSRLSTTPASRRNAASLTVVRRLYNLGPRTGRDIETRYRCVELRHEPHTYNPLADKTWCRCGRVIRSGDVAVAPTRYEREERWAQEQRLETMREVVRLAEIPYALQDLAAAVAVNDRDAYRLALAHARAVGCTAEQIADACDRRP